MLGVALRAIPIFQGPTLTRVLACREGSLRAKSSPAMRPSKRAHGGESSRGFRSPPRFYSLEAGGECTGFGRTIASQKRGGILRLAIAGRNPSAAAVNSWKKQRDRSSWCFTGVCLGMQRLAFSPLPDVLAIHSRESPSKPADLSRGCV
jgi:hypothetical protein